MRLRGVSGAGGPPGAYPRRQMLHKDRTWAVKDVHGPQELAELLTRYTWTGCTGFRHQGYLYLNDSFAGGGAQEYAVVKESTGQQVESITFSWCSLEKALELIRRISAGEFDDQAWDPGISLAAQIQDPGNHRCHLCA